VRVPVAAAATLGRLRLAPVPPMPPSPHSILRGLRALTLSAVLLGSVAGPAMADTAAPTPDSPNEEEGNASKPVEPGTSALPGQLGAPGTAVAPTRPSAKVLYQDGHGGRRLMDGAWQYRLDAENRGLKEGFQRQSSPAGWTPVKVPNAWNALDNSDESQRGTVSWYRKDFISPGGGRWKFRFESVNYDARYFLNGKEIGTSDTPYLPVEMTADGLKRGRNSLVVRVNNRRTEDDIPPGQDQSNGRPGGGWWNYGGLLREVYMRRVGTVDIEDFGVRPTLPCRSCDASAVVRATLSNPGKQKRTARLRATVAGKSVPFKEVTLPPGRSREVTAKVAIPNPRLWEPGSPELYTARASAGGTSYSTHFGVRSIKVVGGRVMLNGRPVSLRGASIHEDHPGVGAALTPEMRRDDVALMRELGVTQTRAHYPLHPQYLEMFDREGILMWDEIPFYRVPTAQVNKASVRAKGLAYLDKTVRRDYNHPSVFAWSIGNELASRPNENQQRYIRDAVSATKKLDPSRMTALDFAGYPTTPLVPVYRKLDALGVNAYFGWYVGTDGALIDRTNLGPYLDQLHRYYPKQGLFVQEFGAEANRSGPIDEKGTFEYQRDLIGYHLDTYDRRPFVNGANVWLLRDFKVRPDWDGGNPEPNPPYNEKGLVGINDDRKPAFFEAQRMFRAVEPQK
jgi:beta-glucuronidase